MNESIYAQETRRVLIVEDDAKTRKAMMGMMRYAGFVVYGYSTAEGLLATNNVQQSACLVCELQLPGISGFELHRRLVMMGNAPPVIFSTGLDDPLSRQRAKQCGAASFLVKPFFGHELVQAVEQALRIPLPRYAIPG